jgi:hypothetical protein
MLFDAHEDLIKRLMREHRVGKRDVDFATVELGPNKVVRVSARSEDGLEFLEDLRTRVPVINVRDYVKRGQLAALQENPIVVGPEDEEEDEEEDVDEDELDDEEELDEDDLEEEEDEELDEDE